MAVMLTDALGREADPLGEPAERTALRMTIRQLLDRHAPPERVAELDASCTFDFELHARLAEIGVPALGGPTEHGGAGDVRDQVAAIEELAAGPTSMAAFVLLQYMAVQVLQGYGQPMHQDTLRQLIAGTIRVSFAMSEPGGGTDVARAMRTTARRDADGTWRLDGHKTWITGADMAHKIIVLARTSQPETGYVDGITMFLVDAEAPGIAISEIRTLGLHSVSTCDVFLDDVVAGDEAIIGTVGGGFRATFATLNRERLNSAAALLGGGRAALEYAVKYGHEREAFGRPLGAFQALQHRLVDGALALEAARGLVVRAAEIEARGGRADIITSMAKVAASQAAAKVTQDALLLLGGAGYSQLTPVERWFRDVRLWNFAPMSDEMARNYIGERLLGLPRSY